MYRRIACRSVLASLAVAGLAAPALATFDATDKTWEGITFSSEGAPAQSELSGAGPNDTFSSRQSNPGAFPGTIGWFANSTNAGGVNASTFTAINANNQPWYRVTFTDNTSLVSPNDISLFVGGSPIVGTDPRF